MRLNQLFISLGLFLILFSCNEDESKIVVQSNAKEVTKFVVNGVQGTIDVNTNKISVSVTTTDVTNLVPTIEISDKATINPKSGVAQDFSNPVSYTVTAEDGSTKIYSVSVTGQSVSNAKEITKFVVDGVQGTVDRNANKVSVLVTVTDVTNLIPTIEVSDKATINPKSGIAQDFSNPVSYVVTAEDGSTKTFSVSVTIQANTNISSFTHNGKTYEIVQEAKSWKDAAAFAVTRGGFLAEINDQQEQDAIFQALNNANITPNNTVAPDGGGGSYVWLGGNDIGTGGNWVWNGNNQGTGTPFWSGATTGNVVNNSYVNWGRPTNGAPNPNGPFNEPDNFNGAQDALGLSLNGWPLGFAGQWNDVDETNRLFFVIELN
ncbi:DUF5018 domain-containing protein [Tenacibaculum jejuense]|uniref:C-type lectin domain-containing protein n=1 Tax=Tenacibaculum jejuense TaxID=584609 RepID=A0A238U5E5_9FLAO|nr:DUF5018 domain-containing protein [Tenacibaculum jejuense]SNR14255.1 protein of unknown function [Tenacibaculum jejuense]